MHWSDYLTVGFDADRGGTVRLDVDPTTDSGAAVLLASRVRGIYDAIKRGTDGAEMLEESSEDLLHLLDHLHRVIATLTAAEDDVLLELRARGVTSRVLADRLDTHHRAVLRREQKILRAHRQGRNSSAVEDDDSDIVDEQ